MPINTTAAMIPTSVGSSTNSTKPAARTTIAGSVMSARLESWSEYHPTSTVVALAPRTLIPMTTPLTPVAESIPSVTSNSSA